MPNHPRVIGKLCFLAAPPMRMFMPSVLMRVRVGQREISVSIVRNRIATAAPNHTGFIGAFLVYMVGLSNGGIHPKIGSGYTTGGQVSTRRARNGVSRPAHVLPITEYAVLAAFIVVKRHDKSSIRRNGGPNNDLIPLFSNLSPCACEIGLG